MFNAGPPPLLPDQLEEIASQLTAIQVSPEIHFRLQRIRIAVERYGVDGLYHGEPPRVAPRVYPDLTAAPHRTHAASAERTGVAWSCYILRSHGVCLLIVLCRELCLFSLAVFCHCCCVECIGPALLVWTILRDTARNSHGHARDATSPNDIQRFQRRNETRRRQPRRVSSGSPVTPHNPPTKLDEVPAAKPPHSTQTASLFFDFIYIW